MTEKTSTFLVTHAEDDSAVLKDVHDGQVHTLSSNPGVEADDAIEATVEPEPPMEVTWTAVEIDERRSLTVHESDEPPTSHERDIADEQEVGDLERTERAGIGEIHVLSVPPEETEDAVADVLDDEGTLSRAARLGVNRVEVRSEDGTVSVRYLP
ncbi:hypothetical protein BG842_17550 [Haladaptatus sp. W1]|uniref:DUF5812 family protein n=1 Tax=unclassified Haladaptatus TaxID=2622732 RepID=UPI000849B13B|nr:MULTISPECIES: DUF5812 family protein [unclassified Haladaptatus]ODR82628.1 hypothetical protein BG842_17550 [Haladaptatus sp. W1]GKZ13103.1 hypothetical protein HAL_09840 [Haladaptatus sp. T7]